MDDFPRKIGKLLQKEQCRLAAGQVTSNLLQKVHCKLTADRMTSVSRSCCHASFSFRVSSL